MQELAVALYTGMESEERDVASEATLKGIAGMLDYAQRHREVIGRFGRFPHRNAILNRPSTAEEQAYLQQPGSGF